MTPITALNSHYSHKYMLLNSPKATVMNDTHSTHVHHNHAHKGIGNLLKELFTLKRISIVAAVLIASHFIGNFIRNALGMKEHEAQSELINSNNFLLKEAAIVFTQILFSSLLAISLEKIFTKGVKFNEAIKDAFSNDSIKLALSLSAFNTFAEVGTHAFKHSNFYSNLPNNQTLTDLTSLLVKFIGTIAVGRLVAGANSIATMFVTACPCCNMPICAVELFSLAHSLLTTSINFVNNKINLPKLAIVNN